MSTFGGIKSLSLPSDQRVKLKLKHYDSLNWVMTVLYVFKSEKNKNAPSTDKLNQIVLKKV